MRHSGEVRESVSEYGQPIVSAFIDALTICPLRHYYLSTAIVALCTPERGQTAASVDVDISAADVQASSSLFSQEVCCDPTRQHPR